MKATSQFTSCYNSSESQNILTPLTPVEISSLCGSGGEALVPPGKLSCYAQHIGDQRCKSQGFLFKGAEDSAVHDTCAHPLLEELHAAIE